MVAAEWEQRRSRGYFSLPRAFVAAWRVVPPAEGATLLLSARLAGERAAAVLFLVHGRTATYHLGWTGPAGRQSHAHNLLMWRAFVALQDRGVEVLDLGGVDTVREPGIARFKIGTGGRVCTLVGSYA
jgi:lipid II:glycine glycyltransferase (peptidoglycan interpeptide bridge formation enzyme)